MNDDDHWIMAPPVSPLSFCVHVGRSDQKMKFSKVSCSLIPVVFNASHCNSVIWIAEKHDSLLRRTLERISVLHQPELLNLVRGFLFKYALVFVTKSPRVEFADIFIFDAMSEAMEGLGAIVFAKHPYEDPLFLSQMETACGNFELFGQFENHRIFQKV